MQNQNTWQANNGTHNNNAEINHNNHLHHTTTATTNGQVQDNFNHALPPPPPYSSNTHVNDNGHSTDVVNKNGKTSAKINGSSTKPLKVTTIQVVKDVEKNGFELSRKDKKGFTTDAGGGALAMGGSAHGIQSNHRTS